MRRLLMYFLILLTVALVGCLPQVQATSTLTPTFVALPSPTTTLTVADVSPSLPGAGCTVVTKKPTPGPTAESIIPPVSDKDWVVGPADAKITIIEYSDFQ